MCKPALVVKYTKRLITIQFWNPKMDVITSMAVIKDNQKDKFKSPS